MNRLKAHYLNSVDSLLSQWPRTPSQPLRRARSRGGPLHGASARPAPSQNSRQTGGASRKAPGLSDRLSLTTLSPPAPRQLLAVSISSFREKALEDKVSLHWKSENNTISEINGTKVFNYDRVFHSSDNTQELYEGVAVPIIQSAVQGYNGTIFAYGQTASGKTYTMMGNEDSAGIIPKAIQHVFKVICEIPEREFLLRVSYMEIYNETITDLLCDIRKKKPLGIREDVNRNTYVEDLIEEVVVAPEQVMEWIRKGEKNRHYGETKMNEHSSRSHTIFRMIIESRERSDPANANCDGAVMVSHLNLVDLAGSERASQTGSEGVRLKEGCNINRSLFILGQVIKKLCDDPSGFINYRDSKLTRILQNSLGGNAKTVIICTITPVSFDETLSTLQFANTAKRMKNSPKVNEVLDDDALLKRYRKEILDLKKQLEEVSSKTQIHAMEKDQLAQLLEEKNSLQKVQEDRIRNLTQMLVTSASFSSKQNAKAKRRRRVTWAPGKINQANVSYFEDFEKTRLTETKKMKMSLSALPDVEDSVLENSEHDNQCLMASDQISDVEWTSGPNMNWTQKDFEESVQLCEALALEKDIAVNEINVLQANFNNLVLENEQLKVEINEMKEKLKEKVEMDEFEALEKQTQKDHEAEINSKLEQLKEKENKIKILQNRVEELQKAGAEKRDSYFSVGDSDKLIEEIQQLNKSLLDSETVALDAKKESAFLRTENLELKEKMNELLNTYKQMQKDVQLYQSQIEAGKASYKKMQAELQKELQSVFQENTRLTSLLEGKAPKDLLSLVELEKKAADLKGELEKALKENALLHKKVNELSELQSLPNTVEIQQKEILEKSEELNLLKSEREKLLSAVADNEVRLKHMTEEIGKSKDDLADAQLKYVKSDQEYVALKQLHEELEQKYVAMSENYEHMKLQIDMLSKEAQESKTTLDEVKLELSSKMKELEEKTAEHKQLLEERDDFIQTQQKLNEMEQLKEHEKIMELRLEAKDSEIQAVLQQLTECQEEIKTLTQERDYLKQKEKSLQAETDQLKEDIKDTVSMNILAHEELRNTQSSLKKSQDTVKKLEKNISEKESEILSVEEALGKTIKELEIRMSQMTEEIKIITSERAQLAEAKSENNSRESDQLQALKEQIFFLTQENSSLQDKLNSLHLKKEEYGEGTLIPQIQEKSIEQELLLLREELSQAQRKMREMEEVKANECQRESENIGRTDFIPELHDCQEVSSLTKTGDDNLKMQLEHIQSERDQLKETIQETISMNSQMQEELRCAHTSLRQHQETIVELKGSISEKENQLVKVQEALKETTDELQQKLNEVTENLTRVSSEYGKLLAEKEQIERTMNEHICQQLEKITLLTQEKDKLQQMVETCKAERDQLEADCQESKERSLKVLTEMENLQEELKHQKEQADIQKNMLANGEEKLQNTEEKLNKEINKLKEKVVKLNEDLDLVTNEKHHLLGELKKKAESESSNLPQLQKQCDLLAQERDQLQEMLKGIREENNKLEINLQESIDKILETEKELKWQQELLSNEKIKAEEREEHLLKVQRRSEILEDSLTNKIQQLTETLNSVSCEKDQLLAERTSHSSQLKEQISLINQEKDELQKLLQDVRSERDQLKTELQKNSKMCVETNAKLECALDQLKQRSLNDMSVQVNPLDNAKQMVDDSLKEITLKIKELLEKFPNMGKRYECLSAVSLNLKNELNSQKALIAVILTQLSSEESKQVKRLQTENEKINSHLQSLLNKLKFLFSRVCLKKREYHTTVNKYEMELLEEKRKQDQLRAQIQCLRKSYLDQNEISSQEFNISKVLQSLHLDAESILKDVSEMESELLSIEAELQQEESTRKETTNFWEARSGTSCDAEELKEELKKDNERLLQVINFWTPKVKILLQLSSDLDARTANYCKNADVELKQRKEKSEELLQELSALKEQRAPGGSASLLLEEENYRLHNKLKAAEQDIKAMEVKIQKLENVINEAGKNIEEKDDRINKLQAQIRMKTETSELTQLQDKLNETEKCLRTALTENQSLQAKLDKGAELYKEEIDHLKTQLVKYDMERMKQSNAFDMQLANYKALAEHKEQQLRKLKEELRRAQQDQDVTAVLEKETPQQSQIPLTCGGGSGIVQSTQILVLKSEQAKLQKENLHLKKQNDLILSNELQLKEELRKWKERALKWKERSLRETSRDAVPRSPRKTMSHSLKEQTPSPSKEPVSQEIVAQNLPKPLPLTCPTNFFDNSSLGMLADTRPAGIEPTEEQLKHWFGTSEKDKAPDCIAQ
ncbi:PREDICTED: centromere-associated protein E [Charadrius vociferus]|uniref:centromere-associated protein E n=1 Tax=Charadrius vociferus TaxID=50402 RepID=UPI000521734D|nr:PREDICTED: centromere-associated protein E [Charadrius vociferus]